MTVNSSKVAGFNPVRTSVKGLQLVGFDGGLVFMKVGKGVFSTVVVCIVVRVNGLGL